MATRLAYLGTLGWLHEAWNGAFYPEGLPAEWLLSYYNTQFSCVWLDAAFWTRHGGDDAAHWRDDTRPDFRFLMETPVGALPRQSSDLRDRLGPQAVMFGGRAHPDLLWFDAATAVREIADRVSEHGASGRPVYLLSRDADLASIERVRTLLELLGL